ncbi:hypothetical protein VTI74DRAFT_10054 [Chaetomium olivicolor]
MLVPASPTPPPTPTPASVYGLMPLQPRYTDFFGYDAGCLNVNNGLKCTSILSSCYSGFLAATDYNAAATSCYCNYGIPYLDCFFSQVATGTCASYYGVNNRGQYQMSFFSEYCGSIPPSAMANIQPPTSVSLDLDTVKVVTATGALKNQPDYAGEPSYKGTGDLLKGPCSQTDFTLVDAGSTVYYAGFMGCNKDRPECCPWAVATSTYASDAQGNRPYDFPKPINGDLAQLAKCADDYYSISGGCCPNGFWPFTGEVGGITPCWSSISRTRAPTLTVGKDDKTKPKPTSAVVNIVWSMRYPVSDPGSGGLSTAAKAGIGAGAGVAAILIAGLAFCLWRTRRKNKKLAEAQAAPLPPPTQPQEQPQVMQQAPMPPMPNNQYHPGAPFGPGMVPPGNLPTQQPDRASMVTTISASSPTALMPQHTGTSGGAVSELSSQSGQNLLQNAQPGGYLAANPRASYPSSGAGSPAVGNSGQAGYPAPIAEADEGAAVVPQYAGQQQQYGYQQQQQYGQQYPPQQQYYAVPGQGQGLGQGQYYPSYQQAGAAYAYPPQQYPHQQQQQYPANLPEMSAQREADPPQEMVGSQVPPYGMKG